MDSIINIRNIIKKSKSIIDLAGGLKSVYFVGCGGSQAALYPGKYLIQNEALSFGTGLITSNEFVHATPKSVGPQSIVICCSLKATAETLNAIHVANNLGAITIALTGSADTDMAKNGKFVVLFSNGENLIFSKTNQSNVLKIGFEILNQFELYPHYDEAISAFVRIDDIVSRAKQKLLPDMQLFARKFKNEKIFYVLGSGPCFYNAYSMAYCHFMEMQNLHSVCIHSGEYFHGPFETTDENLPIILLKSTGRTRSLDNRVENFIKQYAKKFVIIDAEDTDVELLGANVSEYFNSPVMFHIERAFVYALSLERDYSMETRRYMWKVPY